jgi:hypothetical protein
MNDLVKIFAILLMVLILISSFGGGLRLREPFENDSSETSDLKINEALEAASAATEAVSDSVNAALSAPVDNADSSAPMAPSDPSINDEEVPLEMKLLAQKMLSDASDDSHLVQNEQSDEVEGFEGGCMYAGCM